VRQFLGLAGYYRRFIEGFSKITKPLAKLNQKHKKYIWEEDQESAFQLLKQKIYKAPILALPEGNDDFVYYCDASLQGLGASTKKPSSSKETLKGKAPTKGSKTGKSASVKELVEEPIVEVFMDDVGDDV
nr:putative reverse transcriptase domain-containing protein [Tanacetum cinerariifolium]